MKYMSTVNLYCRLESVYQTQSWVFGEYFNHGLYTGQATMAA